MKEKITKTYICEICGAEYAQESSAKSCEAFHFMPTEIESLTFHPQQTWPDIVVRTKDGRAIVYGMRGPVISE